MADQRWKNVFFVDPQPTDEIRRHIAASEVQVVNLADCVLRRATMPRKVPTAMAAARPIFARAASDVAYLVTNNLTGLAAILGTVGDTLTRIRELSALPDGGLAAMGPASTLENPQQGGWP